MTTADYEFDGLPIEDIRSGTSILVSGPMLAGTRTLALRMLSGSSDEGAILISTNHRADHIAGDWDAAGFDLSPGRAAILDCVGDESQPIPAQVESVTSPSDLTGIGMRFSDIYRSFERSGVSAVRTGLLSVSTLLSYGDLKPVGRFIHALAGRIASVDGLGLFVVDPSMHDDKAVSTLSQFCDGRLDVREGADGLELRVRGLPTQSREWRSFDLTVD